MSDDASNPNEASSESPKPEAEANAQGAQGASSEGPKADAGPETGKDGPGKDGPGKDGKDEGPKAGDGQGKKSDENAKDGPEVGEPSKDHQDAFKLFERALGATDWAYKAKTGSERDLGHQSVGIAERAYISAALYDKKMADKLWEDATHKPPKPELQARIEEARKVDPKVGVAELTAGLTRLEGRQKLWNLTLNREKLDQQMSRWEGNIGDARERARKHQRDANDQLLQPEKQGQHDDSGLEMFLRSIRNGFKAGRDLRAAGDNRAFSRENEDRIRGSKKAHGILHKEIENFKPGDGPGMDETTGEVGKTSRRFGGVGNLVRTVLDRKKPGADMGEDKLAEAARKAENVAKDAGSRSAASMARKMAGQDAGIS